jgi:nucleolar pre-ribosomal-associated protein 2
LPESCSRKLGSRLPEDIKQFGLAQAHYALCDRLEKATSPATFLLTSKAIHLLIDQNPACMTQFNIGRTLSCVLTVSARASTPALVAESPDVYPSLCRLVAMLIRRYRKRLEDSFHILVDTLQGLLRLLLSRPHEEAATAGPATATTQEETWARDARHFSRLLTLICEPAVGSGSTSAVQGSGGPRPAALDSEKDRARRFAGQFMYYVLMAYVRLQVEEHGAAAAVPHAVRAALEPGMFAIMDVTTRGGKGIMSAAMDASTRAVLREMYKRYERFGKWTGV